MFMSDTEDTNVERSEMAIRAMCRGTDISGTEVVEVKRISEGSRYRSYVLVSLPMGEANQLAIRNDRKREAKQGKERAEKAWKELDVNR